MRLNATNPVGRLAILAKGENGVGKSIALASFALLGKVYFIFAEPRFKSLQTYYERYLPRVRPDLADACKIILNNIEYDYSPNYAEFKSYAERAQEDSYGMKWFAVFYESLTSVAEASVQQTFELKPEKGKKVGGIAVTNQEHYSAEFSGLMDLLYISMRTQAHIGWTGHVMPIEKTENNKTTVSRLLVMRGKKPAVAFPVYFDEQWHFQVDPYGGSNPTYEVLFKHQGDDNAKTALDLPSTINITNDLFIHRLFDYYPRELWLPVTREMMPEVELVDGESGF